MTEPSFMDGFEEWQEAREYAQTQEAWYYRTISQFPEFTDTYFWGE